MPCISIDLDSLTHRPSSKCIGPVQQRSVKTIRANRHQASSHSRGVSRFIQHLYKTAPPPRSYLDLFAHVPSSPPHDTPIRPSTYPQRNHANQNQRPPLCSRWRRNGLLAAGRQRILLLDRRAILPVWELPLRRPMRSQAQRRPAGHLYAKVW